MKLTIAARLSYLEARVMEFQRNFDPIAQGCDKAATLGLMGAHPYPCHVGSIPHTARSDSI